MLDLLFFARDKLVYWGEDGRIHGAPDRVVEILSPGTRKRDRTQKMQAYRQAGVRWYWLADQDDLTSEEFILTTRGYQIRQVALPGEVFNPALFPEIQLNLIVTIQAAQNLTGTCRTPMFRLSPGDTLLLEKCRSNSQVAE